jgi:hypothetical protein
MIFGDVSTMHALIIVIVFTLSIICFVALCVTHLVVSNKPRLERVRQPVLGVTNHSLNAVKVNFVTNHRAVASVVPISFDKASGLQEVYVNPQDSHDVALEPGLVDDDKFYAVPFMTGQFVASVIVLLVVFFV